MLQASRSNLDKFPMPQAAQTAVDVMCSSLLVYGPASSWALVTREAKLHWHNRHPDTHTDRTSGHEGRVRKVCLGTV